MSHRDEAVGPDRKSSVTNRKRRAARHRRRFPTLLRADFWSCANRRGWWQALLINLGVARPHRQMIAAAAPSKPRRDRRLRRGAQLRMETLEPRQLLSVNTTTVNDNWRLSVDNDSSTTLTVGDTVDSFNDGGIGTVTGSYGVNAFGTVTSGSRHSLERSPERRRSMMPLPTPAPPEPCAFSPGLIRKA